MSLNLDDHDEHDEHGAPAPRRTNSRSSPPPPAPPPQPVIPRARRRWLWVLLGSLAIGLIVFSQFVSWLTAWADQEMTTMVEEAVLRVGDPATPGLERRRTFVVDDQGRPNVEDLDAFAAELQRRCGRLRGISIQSVTPDGSAYERIAAVSLLGSEADLLATIRFRIVPGSTSELALAGIEVLDRQRGDFAIGDLGDGKRGAAAGSTTSQLH